MKTHEHDLQKATVKPVPRRPCCSWLPSLARVGVLGTSLLLASPLWLTALDRLVPRAPSRVQGLRGRLVWYFQDGRLTSDLRSLTALVEYLASNEPQSSPTSALVPTNLPVAGIFTLTSTNS
jgi:hypothetical protein